MSVSPAEVIVVGNDAVDVDDIFSEEVVIMVAGVSADDDDVDGGEDVDDTVAVGTTVFSFDGIASLHEVLMFTEAFMSEPSVSDMGAIDVDFVTSVVVSSI